MVRIFQSGFEKDEDAPHGSLKEPRIGAHLCGFVCLDCSHTMAVGMKMANPVHLTPEGVSHRMYFARVFPDDTSPREVAAILCAYVIYGKVIGDVISLPGDIGPDGNMTCPGRRNEG